jgi:hypothetical protein
MAHGPSRGLFFGALASPKPGVHSQPQSLALQAGNASKRNGAPGEIKKSNKISYKGQAVDKRTDNTGVTFREAATHPPPPPPPPPPPRAPRSQWMACLENTR